MATVVVKHQTKTSAPPDPLALVDGVTWDTDPHVVTGLENVQNVDTTNANNITAGSQTGTGALVRGTSPNITTPTGIVASDVGLGNVNNTSDANKPVSTATAAAIVAERTATTSISDKTISLSNVANVFNVMAPPYLAKGDGVTNDTTAINTAMLAAIAAKGILYFPSTPNFYNATITIPDGTTGLTICGDGYGNPTLGGPGSVIQSASSSPIIGAVASSGGNTSWIKIHDVKVINTGAGTAIKLWDINFAEVWDVFAYAATGIGLDVQGCGNFLIDNPIVYGYPAMSLGNGAGTLTNSGPGEINAGQMQANGGGSPALIIQGDLLGVVFNASMFVANGGTQAATVTIDGPATGVPVGSVVFNGCHGESNYNSTNTGADFLIGGTHKFGAVIFDGGNFWGHGNSINYQQDWVRIVAAREVIVNGVITSKQGAANGYSRAMIRLETTFPGGNDGYRFEANQADGSGTLYSDAGGHITGLFGAMWGGRWIDVLNLGNALDVADGGTGLRSGTSGGIPYYSATTAITSSAALTANKFIMGGGAGAAPVTGSSGIGSGKVFQVNNSLTLVGTDSTTMTFPGASATIARTDAAQTFTGTQTMSGAVNVGGVLTAGPGTDAAEFASTIALYGTNNGQTTIEVRDSANHISGFMQVATPKVYFGSGTAHDLVFRSNNTDRFSVTSAGIITFLMGTASTSSTTGAVVNDGGLGNAGAIYGGAEIATGTTTVASLPSVTGRKGARHFVTDATAAMTAGIGAIVAGGGANNVPVYCDGTNWRIG